MGKIKKVATLKRDASVSPAFSDFIKLASTTPLAQLPSHLSSLPRRWPFPRGDLYHWIGVLNRFDEALESFSAHYGLAAGPQIKPFGNSWVLAGSPDVDQVELEKLRLGTEGDRETVEAILDFTRLLLEKCGNRNLYNSSDRLNELLNTTSLSLVHCTLRVALCLAQRYRERVRSGHFPVPTFRANYSIDLQRIEQLAQPIPQPQPTTKQSVPVSPVKASKGKDKATRQTRRTSQAPDAPSLRSLCGTTSNKESAAGRSEQQDWEAMVHVEVKFGTTNEKDTKTDAASEPPQNFDESTSPTPFRRQSTIGQSRLSRLSTSDEVTGPVEQRNGQVAAPDAFQPSVSEINSSPIEEVISSGLPLVPVRLHYDLLQQLRTAYALMASSSSRECLLAVRLLAIANLAYIVDDENEFQQKILGAHADASRRQQFICQVIELVYVGSGNGKEVPLVVQIQAFDVLAALTKQKTMSFEVFGALGVTASHGALLSVVQKSMKDLANDDDDSDTTTGDEWRDRLFSLLRVMMDANVQSPRSSDGFASSELFAGYVEVLKIHSNKAQRLYTKVLDFFELFTHQVKDGLVTLLNNKTYEAVSDLAHYLVSTSLELVEQEAGFPTEYRTPTSEYEAPYLSQQNIRSILSFINSVSTHQSVPAERVLRSLIDSPNLLTAFRFVIQHAGIFGAFTWSEVVKAMNGFLHNEPTSFAVIAEAGLSKAFLQSITLEKGVGFASDSMSSDATGSTPISPDVSGPTPAPKLDPAPAKNDKRHLIGILPAAEAISNASQAFNAICLTSAGFELFKKSGALESFFEIFLSPPHVKVMSDQNLLGILGSTFDEFVRHHPDTRKDVLSCVIATVRRVSITCRGMANTGAGSKLWVDSNGTDLGIAGGHEALTFEVHPYSSTTQSLMLPNGSVCAPAQSRQSGNDLELGMLEERDDNGLGVADYMTPITGFLMSFFENSVLCSSFIEGGGAELLLDLTTVPSLPFDFFRAGSHGSTAHELAQIVHMMAETKPHLVLPSLLSRALSCCQHLQPFAHQQPQGGSSYFDPLTQRRGQASDNMDAENNDEISENGTKLAKSLTSLHFLTTILVEVFEPAIYSTRNPPPALFTQVNLADLYTSLCQQLGVISAACVREEIALQKNVPDLWLHATRPKDIETGSDEVDQILGLEHESHNLFERDTDPATGGQGDTEMNEPPQAAPVDSAGQAEDQGLSVDRGTAAFKNVVILRHLLIQLPSSITQYLSILGRGLIAKRRPDTYPKQNAFMVAEAIAKALMAQMDPSFLKSADHFQSRKDFLETRFAYLVVILVNVYQVLLDTSSSPEFKPSVTSVVLMLKRVGGLNVLKEIGNEFFTELKSRETSNETIQSMIAANSGLKMVLDILDQLTSARSIVESPQSSSLKNQDRNRPYYFVPAQCLLELRMETLPLVREIWESDYADQASKAVVEKLVSILRHILSGEHESDAFRSPDGSSLPPHHPRKSNLKAELVNELKLKGYDEALAREALFRCNNGMATAEDYCRSYKKDTAKQRFPVPTYEVEATPAQSRGTPSRSPAQPSSRAEPSNPLPLSDFDAEGAAAAIEETVPDPADEVSLTNGIDDAEVPSTQASLNAMSIDSLLNPPVERESRDVLTPQIRPPNTPAETPQHKILALLDDPTTYTVSSIDSQRLQIRAELTEQSLNVLNEHPDVTFQLSELILSATQKLSENEAGEFRENAASLIVNSLISLQTDDMSSGEGKKIAAYSHFTALLLQDKEMYDACLEQFGGNFGDLLGFLKVAPKQNGASEETSPWIGNVLLIFEKMLSDDAEPRKIQWMPPTKLEEPIAEVVDSEKGDVIDVSSKKSLFHAVVEVMPHISKDKSLALSVVRILVILTRNREIAVLLSNKRNIQRLFVMVKQLGSGADDRLHSAILLILRHVIEDDDTLRQIMRSEIVAAFDSRSSRQTDTTAYVRSMYHLVLRSPNIFVEITNEKLKLLRYDSHPRPQTLVLKPSNEATEAEAEIKTVDDSLPGATEGAELISASIEPGKDATDSQVEKSKAPEVKPPVVEHPDGVIHFLLSELLSYKDVDDKVPSDRLGDERPTSSPTDQDPAMEIGNGTDSDVASDVDQPSPALPKPREKQLFKAEDHPIYVYRCFLLQCLTELLHSYNRTKIEFINFSRKADPLAMTPSKPRSGVLNYFLNGLVPVSSLGDALLGAEETIAWRKRTTVSEWAMRVIVALCSKTGELGVVASSHRYSGGQRVTDNDDEPDLGFVRRFVLEHALKAFKDANGSIEAFDVKYARVLSLADLFFKLLSKPMGNPDGSAGTNNTSYKTLCKMMFEKNFITVLTGSLAELDLTNAGSKRVVKHILKPLNELSQAAHDLSTSSSAITSALGSSEDDVISSASSVSELDDDREETPDLFRNSTLGMLEPRRREESSSDSDDHGDDEDEEMYEDEYADDMEFEDGMPNVDPNNGEVVSDEDIDEEHGGPGPMEGMPGDVPVDIELVMDDHHMDVDTDGDDDDVEEDDDDDDDDSDDEGEDFVIETDDAIMEGEINGDNENDSLDDGEPGDGEEEWPSDDDEGEGDANPDNGEDGEVDRTFEQDIVQPERADQEAAGDESGHESQLNNLLQILGEGPNRPGEAGALSIIQGAMQEEMEADEDDGEEDPDDMDENAYHTFDDMMNNDMMNDPDTPWPWDEPPPYNRGHGHRHLRTGPGGLTSFMTRQITSHGMPSLPAIHRSHRHAGPARSNDDGTNPLLQRPGAALSSTASTMPAPVDFVHGFSPGFTAFLPPDSGHGGMLDAIMEAVQRGDGRISMSNRNGLYDIRVAGSPDQLRDIIRPTHTSSFPRSSGDDPQRSVSFTPATTVTRWQEEARLLFGNNYYEKTQYVVTKLLSVLIPPAIDEEKTRIKKAKEEEEKAELERQERAAKEAEEQRKREEEECAQAAKKAEEEAEARARAEAEAAASVEAPEEPFQSVDEVEPMQDVQATGAAAIEEDGPEIPPASAENGPSETAPRVYTTIRGRQVDITDLSIDADFLAGLPEEIREEVIMQQYTERRNQAAEQGRPESSEINAEFLDALPADIREEIVQQEAQDRRRREREAARREAAQQAGGPARAEEMDPDSFMASLDPSLRRSILADQSDEVIQQLAPEYAAEARAIISRQLRHFGGPPMGRELRDERALPESNIREQRRQIVQMVDKAGVATLMRLMFLPQGTSRQMLHRILRNVCGHRQTRGEVINLLLLVLKEGSADVSAIERSLAQLSLRAKTPVNQKTPQPLKRTLSLPLSAGASDEMTPMTVVQQCLDALTALTQYSVHVASVFLREHDGSSAVKTKAGKKGKGKETRASKFALNDLISLLDRKLIVDNSSCIQALSALLATITSPLAYFLRKDRLAEVPKAAAIEAPLTTESLVSPQQSEVVEAPQSTSNVEIVEVEPASPVVPAGSTSNEASAAAGAAEHSTTSAEAEAEVSGATANGVDEKNKQDEDKAKKQFEPPVVPDSNLRLVVGILCAKECNAHTFRDALTTINNLSFIPGARETFGKELVTQAQSLSSSILSDLDELLPCIESAQSGTDIQSLATTKFSPASSDQAKLLRVLTGLDYVFDPKRAEPKDRPEGEPSNAAEVLKSLYESATFFPLWRKLSACLSAIQEKPSMLGVATILQPLIESLMLVCKNTSLKDAPLSRQLREQSVTTPAAEVPPKLDTLEALFFNFTTEHRKILNELVRQNPKLMSANFGLLVKNPKVLEFDNKRSYFNRQMHSRHREARHPQPPLQLSVRRSEVFLDSFKSLYFKSADEMKYGKLSIRFHGEEGVDAGGVTREWFQVLARGMFNPNYGLFIPVNSDKTTFHPNRLSAVNPEHLMFFKFIGRIIGKALYENRVLDCHFSRAVYKRMLGKTISIKDMESLDLDYYKSLEWILENDVTEIITETMSIESEDFGENRIIDLVENGRNIPVTEENKHEYVQKVAEYRLTGSVQEQLENFLKGFNDIIPAELISIFNEQELELLISGLPTVDIDDWKANTEYHNYSASSQQIQWFWRAMKSFSSEEVAKCLQFITGTSKVPLEGMGQLEGMNGITKFNIHKDFGNKDRLPSSHTCFNQLDLPEYDSYEALKKALYTAMTQGYVNIHLCSIEFANIVTETSTLVSPELFTMHH